MDVVSELPSLTHAQLSEPSIQLTALPVPYTTDYTFMHNSQHAHNISMPHYSPSFLSSRQFESCCGSVRTSRRPSPLSLLSGISTATHYIHTYYILYLISGRLTLQLYEETEEIEKLCYVCDTRRNSCPRCVTGCKIKTMKAIPDLKTVGNRFK